MWCCGIHCDVLLLCFAFLFRFALRCSLRFCAALGCTVVLDNNSSSDILKNGETRGREGWLTNI